MSLSIRSSDSHPAAWRKPRRSLGGSILHLGFLVPNLRVFSLKLASAFLTSPRGGACYRSQPGASLPSSSLPKAPSEPRGGD